MSFVLAAVNIMEGKGLHSYSRCEFNYVSVFHYHTIFGHDLTFLVISKNGTLTNSQHTFACCSEANVRWLCVSVYERSRQ